MAKQERASRTRERFLDASADEFSRHGYAGANLQRIAARVGMTKGALYAHFPSKDALAAVFISEFDRAGYALLHEISEDDPPLTSLRRVTVDFMRRTHADRRFRAGIRLAFEEGCARGRAPALVTDLSATFVRLVGAAQEEGQLTTRHHREAISSLVLATMFGMHYTAPTTALGDGAEQISRLWQLLSTGIPA
ncbi:TetR family transcriptional regulator [Streptomyces broussonetiae]|uniref:TetR/AcrR family transcriptional regulator n=1 Tax=Streptomyces broussonetiae TaxID=2686304 RepID=A0ABV5EGK6_9ACTN